MSEAVEARGPKSMKDAAQLRAGRNAEPPEGAGAEERFHITPFAQKTSCSLGDEGIVLSQG